MAQSVSHRYWIEELLKDFQNLQNFNQKSLKIQHIHSWQTKLLILRQPLSSQLEGPLIIIYYYYLYYVEV